VVGGGEGEERALDMWFCGPRRQEMCSPPGQCLAVGLAPIESVGTLQTVYPYRQASSLDKEQGMHPRTATCPVAPDPASQPR
jgi:hypothetical protein